MPVNKDGFGLPESLTSVIEQIAIAVVNEVAPGSSGVSSVGGVSGAVPLRTVGGNILTDGGGDIPTGGAVDSVGGATGDVDLKTVGGISIVGTGDIPAVGGATEYTALTDAEDADLPVINIPLSEKLALKADVLGPNDFGTGEIEFTIDHANHPNRCAPTTDKVATIDTTDCTIGALFALANNSSNDSTVTMPSTAAPGYTNVINAGVVGVVEWQGSTTFRSMIPDLLNSGAPATITAAGGTNVGDTITCNFATGWENAPVQWQADGVDIVGETGDTYVIEDYTTVYRAVLGGVFTTNEITSDALLATIFDDGFSPGSVTLNGHVPNIDNTEGNAWISAGGNDIGSDNHVAIQGIAHYPITSRKNFTLDVEPVYLGGVAGGIALRVQDTDNFYSLNFTASAMELKQRVGGVNGSAIFSVSYSGGEDVSSFHIQCVMNSSDHLQVKVNGVDVPGAEATLSGALYGIGILNPAGSGTWYLGVVSAS